MQSALGRGVSMTHEQFKNLKDGTTLYDDRMSKRYRSHIFATVRGHDKVSGGVIVYSNGMEEVIPLAECWNYDVFDPETQSTDQLPFY